MNSFIQSEISFCFVISSYNNEKNIMKNLNSIIRQTYTKWRAIYINDFSNDKTSELFNTIMEENNIRDKFIYIENEQQLHQSYCKYTAYQLVKDLEIVCILDGDDWLFDDNVLATLKEYYTKDYMVITSNYNIHKNDDIVSSRIASKYTSDDLKMIRSLDKWLFKHLKTGYGILFKSISEQYLKINDKWLTMVTDVAEMTCVTEFSNANVLCVDDVFYTYNYDNSILYQSSYYNSKDDIERKLIHAHIKQLPICKYTLPHIYIIHLIEDKIKKTHMMKQLEIIQSHYSFIDAIRGHTSDPLYETYLTDFETKIYPKNKYCLYKKHITPGSLGLLQSIFKVLTLFVQSDLEHIIILEDDVFTLKNFHSYLFINEKLLKDKDLIYLGCHSSTDTIYKSNVNDKDVFIDVKMYKKLIYGTYSIILSKKIANYILNVGLENIVHLNLSWDLFLNHVRENTEHTFFLYFKELFIPDVMKDGIQPSRSTEFYKKNDMKLDNYKLYEPDSPNLPVFEQLLFKSKPILPEQKQPEPILSHPILPVFEQLLFKSKPILPEPILSHPILPIFKQILFKSKQIIPKSEPVLSKPKIHFKISIQRKIIL